MVQTVLSYPHMLLIGSSSRNIGKTHLATSIIAQNRSSVDIIGLKVTTIEKKTTTCPHGKDDCNVCGNIRGDFQIQEEKDPFQDKDTSLLLRSGAKKVFWLIVLEGKLGEGAQALHEVLPTESVIVAESNRFRLAVQPGFFLMLTNPHKAIKGSARRVFPYADLTITTDGKKFDYDIRKIRYIQDGWIVK